MSVACASYPRSTCKIGKPFELAMKINAVVGKEQLKHVTYFILNIF